MTKTSKKDHTPWSLKMVRWFFPKLERFAPAMAHRLFVKLFFSPVRYPVPEKERKAASFGKPFSFQISNKNIEGYTWGDSLNYVLVMHGWAGRATQFRRFIKPLLKAGYSVVGFDGPAHGRSSGKQTTIFEFEEAFKKIYDLKGEPAAIVAHSFGGGAILYAAMNGLPVKRLINIASPAIGDEIINTYLRAINGSERTKTFFKQYMLDTYQKTFDEFTAMHFIKHLPQPIELLLVHDETDREVALTHALELINVYPAQLYQTKGLGHTRILKDNTVIAKCVTFIQNGRLTQ